jgi:tape measure domain-containing protein
MAIEVATAYVSIVPTARNFTKNLRSQIGNIADVKVPVVADTRSFLSRLTSLGRGSSVNVRVDPETQGFAAKLHSLIGNQSSLGTSMGSSAGSSFSTSMLSAASKVAAGIAAIFAAQKVIQVGTAAFTETSNFETQRVAFEGILGGADAAKASLDELFEFARVTPFEFPQLLDAGKKLLAFGFGADRIVPIMTNIGNAAAALGATGTDINYVVRALGQIGSKGRVMLEELNQIGEAFPGTKSVKALADAVGVTEAEFTTQLSQPGGALAAYGLTGAQAVDILVESFNNVPGALGAMDRQARTLRGAMSNLKDTMGKFAREVLEPVRVPIINFLIDTFIPAVTKLSAKLPPLVQKATDRLRIFKKAFTSEFDGVGKPVAGFFAQLGDAVGRFVKVVPVAFKQFVSELDGVGKPVDGFFARLGDAVGRFLKLLKPIPGAFIKAFKTGDVTDETGIVGFAERIGRAFKDIIDGVKAFVGAFISGSAEANSSGFLTFMSNLGDTARGVYDWLKEKIPLAVDAFNDAIDKARTKLDNFFTFVNEHEDAFVAVTAGFLGFVAAMKTISTIGSVAGAIAGVLSLGPIGLVVAAIAGLGVAAFLAYEKIQPFHDAVDAVIKAFKDEGLTGAIDEAGKQIGIFADTFGDLWDKVKPKLDLFFANATQFFKDKIAELLHFEVLAPPVSTDFPGTGFASSDSPGVDTSQFDFPGTGFAPPTPPKQFASFGEGFADAMMNSVLPAVGKWIEDNEKKIGDALSKFLAAVSKWTENYGIPGMFILGEKLGPPFVRGFLHAVGQVSVTVTVALALNIESFLDELDKYTAPGGIIDQKVARFLVPGGGLDRLIIGALDDIGRFTLSALGEVGRFAVDAGIEVGLGLATLPATILGAMASLGSFGAEALATLAGIALQAGLEVGGAVGGLTLDVLGGIGHFTLDALDEVGRFAVSAGVEVGLGLATIAATILGAMASIGSFGAEALATLAGIAAQAGLDIIKALGGLVFGHLFDGLSNAFIGAINAMIQAWNDLEFKLPDFDGITISQFGKEIQILPGWGKGPTLSTPNIDLIRLAQNDTRPGAPQRSAFASGAVFKKRFTGMVDMAETARARPEILSPQALMAETFRDVLADVGQSRNGFSIQNVNVTNPVDATADEVVDAMNAKLGWKLTARGER